MSILCAFNVIESIFVPVCLMDSTAHNHKLFLLCFAVFVDISAILPWVNGLKTHPMTGSWHSYSFLILMCVFTCEYVECQKHYSFIWLRWNAWTCSNLEMESYNYSCENTIGVSLASVFVRNINKLFVHFLSFRFISIYCSFVFNAFFPFSLSFSFFFFMYSIRCRVQPHHNMFIGRRMIVWLIMMIHAETLV